MTNCPFPCSLQLYADKVTINVGEIKRSESELATGKKQLQDRLRLFAWATTSLKPTVNGMIRVGELFIAGPRGQSSQVPLKSTDDEGNHIRLRYVLE